MASLPLALLRLARTEGVGPVTYRRLLARFASPEDALAALPGLALAGGRIAPPRIPSLSEVEAEYRAVLRLKGQFLFLGQPGYPSMLAELADAPPVLAVLGDVSLLHKSGIGVVGARNASANGMRLATHIAAELAAELPVISGLARGIDTAAHIGALQSGTTIAVVAGGLDIAYPSQNADLQRRIAKFGAVVAEAPWGTAPIGRHFPKRNRIIAGLCQGLVVIEAALRSGSLLTARLAAEAGREVFAVPGSPLEPRARGGNDLIRQGAYLVESAEDVLMNLPQNYSIRHTDPGFTEPANLWEDETSDPQDNEHARSEILNLMGVEPVAVDEIARRCQLSTAVIKAAILELELAGRIQSLTGDRVVLSDDP